MVSEVEPGTVPDIIAAHAHALPPSAAAAGGLPTLADSGYEGAGIGVHTPIKKRPHSPYEALHIDTRTDNLLLRGIRSLREPTAAEPKEPWRTLKHITLSPNQTGPIVQAALTLNLTWK